MGTGECSPREIRILPGRAQTAVPKPVTAEGDKEDLGPNPAPGVVGRAEDSRRRSERAEIWRPSPWWRQPVDIVGRVEDSQIRPGRARWGLQVRGGGGRLRRELGGEREVQE